MRGFALAFVALFAVGVASADELQKDILSCSSMSDGVKRLECFDNLATATQGIADDKAEEMIGSDAPTPSNWRVRISQSKIDDSKIVVMITDANETVSARFNRNAKPSLILRCLENATSAYINFDGLHMADIQSYGRVTFRVDKQKAFTRSTDVSTDNSALGFWSGGSAIPFIKGLFGGSTLIVQATPFSESAVTFSMNIEGLEDAIQPLRKACNW